MIYKSLTGPQYTGLSPSLLHSLHYYTISSLLYNCTLYNSLSCLIKGSVRGLPGGGSFALPLALWPPTHTNGTFSFFLSFFLCFAVFVSLFFHIRVSAEANGFLVRVTAYTFRPNERTINSPILPKGFLRRFTPTSRLAWPSLVPLRGCFKS